MAQYLGAVGIAVSELDTSAPFYTGPLGMVELQTIDLPNMKEIVLGFEGVRSAAVILMMYTDGTEFRGDNKPAKLVFYVADAGATLDAIREAGFVVEREATAVPSMGGALIGFARDPDGYLIELIQKPPRK
jgi:lactoylglutathione lyase